MIKNELKPCPFCGSTAHVSMLKQSVKPRYFIVCGNAANECIASGHWVFGCFFATREDAIEAWNRRKNNV